MTINDLTVTKNLDGSVTIARLAAGPYSFAPLEQVTLITFTAAEWAQIVAGANGVTAAEPVAPVVEQPLADGHPV